MLRDGLRHARIHCPAALIPAPGQYLLAGDASDLPLPVPMLYTDSTPDGFLAPVPESWLPGRELFLRGPLGRGFSLPASAKKIALVGFGRSLTGLRGLIRPAIAQNAAIALVTDFPVNQIPDEVEVHPSASLNDIVAWADYLAAEVLREELVGLREKLAGSKQAVAKMEAEVLVRVPVPCGGVAECGTCAIVTQSGWKMGCKEGLVFAWDELQS